MNLNNLMNFVNNMAEFMRLPLHIYLNLMVLLKEKNRTLKNMMNAILISSGAPLNLWGRLYSLLVIFKTEYHIRKPA